MCNFTTKINNSIVFVKMKINEISFHLEIFCSKRVVKVLVIKGAERSCTRGRVVNQSRVFNHGDKNGTLAKHPDLPTPELAPTSAIRGPMLHITIEL